MLEVSIPGYMILLCERDPISLVIRVWKLVHSTLSQVKIPFGSDWSVIRVVFLFLSNSERPNRLINIIIHERIMRQIGWAFWLLSLLNVHCYTSHLEVLASGIL